MGRIVEGVKWLYSSPVCLLTLHSYRLRGPREEGCP